MGLYGNSGKTNERKLLYCVFSLGFCGFLCGFQWFLGLGCLCLVFLVFRSVRFLWAGGGGGWIAVLGS